MSFLFGGRNKEKEAKQAKKDEEEAKYLRINLQQLIEENESLKQRFDDQKETVLQNKKLLEAYISSITTQEDLVAKMNNSISALQEKAVNQAQIIKQLRYFSYFITCRQEKTHIESYKTTDTVGGASNTHGNGNDFCKACGRLLPEVESSNTKLLEEQEKLLSEIQAAKAEVQSKLKELKEKPEIKEEGEGAGMLFNMKNLGSLQELLDQAEETDEMLLFTDKKQNVWQIVKRNDIDIANQNPNESGGEIQNAEENNVEENKVENIEQNNENEEKKE